MEAVENKLDRHDQALNGTEERLGLFARVTNLENNHKLMIALMAFLGSNILISVFQLIVQFASK